MAGGAASPVQCQGRLRIGLSLNESQGAPFTVGKLRPWILVVVGEVGNDGAIGGGEDEWLSGG